jgi:hypothetical protein
LKELFQNSEKEVALWVAVTAAVLIGLSFLLLSFSSAVLITMAAKTTADAVAD